jgi:hypothetical protein
MIGSRSTFCKAIGCLASLRVAACLGATLAEDAASTEFSRFTNGLREAVFLTGLGSAAGAAAFVIAARALVVLGVGGSTVAAVLVRAEARVAAVDFAAIFLQARVFNVCNDNLKTLCKVRVPRDKRVLDVSYC